MDAHLSFLMANQGLIKKGSLVWDPFVGTGSILVSCAHFGAHVVGSDIDPRVIRGTKKGNTIFNNFEQVFFFFFSIFSFFFFPSFKIFTLFSSSMA